MDASREDFVLFRNGPFSQWHPARFQIDGREFACAEQYMMFCKARLFGDHVTAKQILATQSPSDHKILGRGVHNFDESTWRIFREGIVFSGNLAKFAQDESLREFLLETGSKTLVEASPHDAVWGVGLAEADPRVLDRTKWRGTNLLGIILMRVRDCVRTR